MHNLYFITSNILVAISFIFLAYIFLIRDQCPRLNWSIFYSALYVLCTLPVVNYICIHFDLWTYTYSVSNPICLPYNLYFIWLVIWSVIPVYIWHGKYIGIIALMMFWLDILMMPQLAEIGVLELHENWLLGEIALILLVFIPSYYWAYCNWYQKNRPMRAFFQVFIMIILLGLGVPFLLWEYNLINSIEYTSQPVVFQLAFIVSLPGLMAVKDLVIVGKGTPFPYDPTENLVRTGVYAYIQNPIQWSITWLFVPMSIYFSSYMPLIGSVVSIAYVYGVSNWQEFSNMEIRFDERWKNYKEAVPKWYFLWKPTSIPNGRIYFDLECQQCSLICDWFNKVNTMNLDILPADTFEGDPIESVTYIDEYGIRYKSVDAISSAMQHINLAYASLGWFLRLPVINELVQIIVDSMGIGVKRDYC